MGGSDSVTTKVAMLSRSEDEWADVDFFFAQLSSASQSVDYVPTCGNILAGVGPAAIELGLVAPRDGETVVNIRSTNTGARTEAVVRSPGGYVEYAGESAIHGVPGAAAPILLNLMDVAGSKTGALFPTGNLRETIGDIEVTLIDAAMPMMIARAASFGLSGYESKAELDANTAFFERMEPMRQEAGRRMGMGDVAGKVAPKVGLLAPPRDGGAVSSRYFVPDKCHPSHAVSGAVCTAACVAAPGTVADGVAIPVGGSPADISIEHVAGSIDVTLQFERGDRFILHKAGVLRTARLLMRGEVMVPRSVWNPVSRAPE